MNMLAGNIGLCNLQLVLEQCSSFNQWDPCITAWPVVWSNSIFVWLCLVYPPIKWHKFHTRFKLQLNWRYVLLIRWQTEFVWTIYWRTVWANMVKWLAKASTSQHKYCPISTRCWIDLLYLWSAADSWVCGVPSRNPGVRGRNCFYWHSQCP